MRKEKPPPPPKFLPIGAVAWRLQTTPDTVYLLYKKGVLTPLWDRGKMVFSTREIDCYEEDRA